MNPERRRKGYTKAKRVANLLKVWFREEGFDEEDYIKHHRYNRKRCSCDMCGNRRRPKKGRKNQKYPTQQEKRADINMKEDIEDLENE